MSGYKCEKTKMKMYPRRIVQIIYYSNVYNNNYIDVPIQTTCPEERNNNKINYLIKWNLLQYSKSSAWTNEKPPQ